MPSCRPDSTRPLCRSSTSTPNACWRKTPTRFSRACTPSSGTCATIPTPCRSCSTCSTKPERTPHVSEVIELLAHASVQSGDLPRARDLYQKLATDRAAESPAHAELPAGGQPARRHLRQQAHYAGRSCRSHRRSGSDCAFGSSALFRRDFAGRPLRTHRRRAFHFLQHARQGARTSGRGLAAGAQRSSNEPASGRACTPARAASPRPRLCCRTLQTRLLRSRISRKKRRATANWPSAMKSDLRLRHPVHPPKKLPFFWMLPPPAVRRGRQECRPGVFHRRSSRGRVCRSRRSTIRRSRQWPKPLRPGLRPPSPTNEIAVEPAEPEFAVVDESSTPLPNLLQLLPKSISPRNGTTPSPWKADTPAVEERWKWRSASSLPSDHGVIRVRQ